MPFCAKCGASVSGTFCEACGTPVGGGAPAPPAPGPGPSAAAAMQDNVAGALCYLLGLVTGILFLVLEPYNRNREIRFHAFQSIFLHLGVVVVAIVLWVVAGAMTIVVPLIGHLILGLLSMVIWLGGLLLWILLLIKTYGGSKIVLPIIGPLAQKQAG